MRKIYADDELHASIVSLIISLLLTPVRGTLDDLYCSQLPMEDGKQNVLYLLHFHLNHPSNQAVLPFLLQQVSHIKPFPAGQRILKLLCAALNDFSIYTDLQFMAAGAFGRIYEGKTNLPDPQIVAIKQMNLPDSIYGRCVLHDIFSEITCLENFRLDGCVTDLYDYGLSGNDYKIIMKRYPVSLKQWRVQQSKQSFADNLPTYFTIYRDILKSVQLLHQNSVVHYDIKADNILLDYQPISQDGHHSFNQGNQSQQQLRVVVGDFGVCKMFLNEEDEYCLASKGTECIQSPEMLTLAIYSKKEGDRYDRRKKVGTTRSSDIWSLGCLLYEILTGEFLFYSNNQAMFYLRVTSNTEPVLTPENLAKIHNNIYAIDFLKYILVRDQQIRPNIDNVLKRFDHIHELVVSSLNQVPSIPQTLNPYASSPIPLEWSLETTIQNYITEVLGGGGQRNLTQSNNQQVNSNNAKIQQKLLIKHSPCLVKIMEEIYLCSCEYFAEHQERLMLSGITHLISEKSLLQEIDLSRFSSLLLSHSDLKNMSSVFSLAPKVMDYLREIFLYRGKVLFVEDTDVNITSSTERLLLRNILLFCLTYFFKCSAYETLTLINSQVLFFQVPYSCLNSIIYASSHLFKIEADLDTYLKAQCICGCSTFILKRSFSSQKKMPHKLCNCQQENSTSEASNCPSDGCAKYLRFIRKRYKLNWDALKWVILMPSNFLIGPIDSGALSDEKSIQVVLNSEGPSKNVSVYQSNNASKNLGQSKNAAGNANANPNAVQGEWTTYKCKICHMWMFALNNVNSQIAFIMNNMIRRNRQGISVANSQMSQKVKTPILRHFNLYELK